MQLLAGVVLASGAIAEMQTGEGKTVVTALPAVLGALAGRGVHVATVNRYLATRDCQSLRPVYASLGLTVGLLQDNDSLQQKRQAYAADITYGTGYEFGFDFLRDQLKLQADLRLPLGQRLRRDICGDESWHSQTVQRKLHFSIVDEVDSVLIDEASTPLVISGPSRVDRTPSEVFGHAKTPGGIASS